MLLATCEPKGRSLRGLSAWARQPARRRRLALEAAFSLTRARLMLITRPFARAVASGSVALGDGHGRDPLAELVWAIEAVGKRLWWRSVCFDRSLALQAMCRRRGIAARLHYGIGKDQADALHAHVWVSVDGKIVFGGEEAGAFRCVGTYPDAGRR